MERNRGNHNGILDSNNSYHKNQKLEDIIREKLAKLHYRRQLRDQLVLKEFENSQHEYLHSSYVVSQSPTAKANHQANYEGSSYSSNKHKFQRQSEEYLQPPHHERAHTDIAFNYHKKITDSRFTTANPLYHESHSPFSTHISGPTAVFHNIEHNHIPLHTPEFHNPSLPVDRAIPVVPPQRKRIVEEGYSRLPMGYTDREASTFYSLRHKYDYRNDERIVPPMRNSTNVISQDIDEEQTWNWKNFGANQEQQQVFNNVDNSGQTLQDRFLHHKKGLAMKMEARKKSLQRRK